MKKRYKVLLIIAGIILVIVALMIFSTRSPEGQAAYQASYYQAVLKGTWAEKGAGDNSRTITFNGDTILIKKNGVEVLNGTFTAKKGSIEIYSNNRLIESPFNLKDDVLVMELDNQSGTFARVSDK
jgi:hypothetical protein